MLKFRFRDIQLNYSVEGVGTPLLFLHGFLEESTIWQDIIPSFISDHQCILVDLPGHGFSRLENAQITLHEIALALQSLAKKIEIEKPVVIGHSMGGYVALELAQLMACSPVLLHSNFWEDSAEKKKDRDRVIDVLQDNASLFIQEAIPNLFAIKNRSACSSAIENLITKAKKLPHHEIQFMTAAMRDRRANYYLAKAERVDIIHGEKDPIIPTEKLMSEVPHLKLEYSLHTMTQVGHMSIWEDPEELIMLLKSIISQ